MSKANLKAYRHVLQASIQIDDKSWTYQVPNLPGSTKTDAENLIKSVSLVSNNTKQEITLNFQQTVPCRALKVRPLHKFISISIAEFRLRVSTPNEQASKHRPQTKPATARESSDYIVRLLQAGLWLNNVHYNFYGHSNSQLKSRTCLLIAASHQEVSMLVESLGDFSKMKTVAKKSKRIGLLFSAAQAAMTLHPSHYEDISDIESPDYIFTDGCGLISPHFAKELSRVLRITFRNIRYTPSVFQIRYRGYKGVLMLDPGMKKGTWAKFRKSMKKFSGGDDTSFSVVAHSKPYSFGNLNDEVVLLLSSLGITDAVLLKKQASHFDFLEKASRDPISAFRFLAYVNKLDLAEKVLMEGLETVRPNIKKLVNSEYDKMLNKRDEQRCRISIPESRLLFGICDAWGVLKEGECAVKITKDEDGQSYSLKGMDVLVTRNPCLHPGDLQKFRAVERDELAHLVDCIVFPTKGKRPAADLMSGGDLDGDTFFVCWDCDLIPEKVSEPAEYPGVKDPVKFNAITDDDRLVYFAKYTNASLGRVKNLYLDWARVKGPMSSECQQLNRLFSTCVDGNRIKIPQDLECPSQPIVGNPPFILDVLHDSAKHFIQGRENQLATFDGYTIDAMELLLSRDGLAVSEFELMKLTQRWCRKNKHDLMEFLHLFNLNLLTAEEKLWTLSQLPPTLEAPTLVFNALSQSKLVGDRELMAFKLNYPGLRWKCFFDSTRDRLATFLDATAKALELFQRKFLVIRVDERLTIAIYVPQKVERQEDCLVDDRIRVFAFPHSQGDETSFRLALPTKKNYRLYCDSNIFQLFDLKRGNTWIAIKKSASDDTNYRSLESTRQRRQKRQETIDKGENFDCRAIVALQKFSRGLQEHLGRIYRNGVLGAEIYIISNKDVNSMLNLDLWLKFVDTNTVVPLFEKTAREYSLPKMKDVDWAEHPDHIRLLIRDKNLRAFDSFSTEQHYAELFDWLLEKSETARLLEIYDYLISQTNSGNCSTSATLTRLSAMITFLAQAPFLSAAFVRLNSWSTFDIGIFNLLEDSVPQILRAHILSSSTMGELIIEPFRKLLSQVNSISMSHFSDLIELITLTTRSPNIALDLILECLEPEALRLLPGTLGLKQRFVQNLFGIALDHIDEAADLSKPNPILLDLKPAGLSAGYAVVETKIRIDAPGGFLNASDHVRLTAASSPTNNVAARPYSMDALVESSQPGSATFRCLHPLPQFLEKCSWTIKNCGSFVTSKAMLDAVRNFYSSDEDACIIANQIMGFGQFDNLDVNVLTAYQPKSNLNDSQNKAVKTSLENPLTCLWGPPGTGKTHTIVEIIRELQCDGVRRILVTAPTHNAVDNVMRKYLGELAKEKRIGAMAPVALRVSTDVRKVAEDLRKYTCDAMMGKDINTNYSAYNKARDQIKRCRLIFTTCIGSALGLLRKEKFDTVLVDEASQQTEPASLVPLVKGCKKAILVGDHVQLGATVQKHAVLQGFDVSLFERLYKNEDVSGAENPTTAKVMLDTQYRMHSSICAFSSSEFYGNKLHTGLSNSSRPLPSSVFPWPMIGKGEYRVVFLECTTSEDLGRKSKSNEGQAKLCQEVCKLLNTRPTSPIKSSPTKYSAPSIAALTPYSAQVTKLKTYTSSFPNVEVSSIDGFQGREADVVVFVTVRCNAHGDIGFLKDLRRLNVVLTRAKTGVVVIGSRATLVGGSEEEESTKVWRRLFETMVRVELPASMD